ncbi:hypothetical protein GMOD_00009614 [Pyrenophora seminiperda CCB06]|uniref:Uncharacterized protein n=1 Tax=Pyrenophora seminiperda CCB06 TaxID=1302712 RepID=A0A3M7MF77_9PLEO|nr:hypothetical protein GMOD_00009614 [Pyrenophora seminiperda CCB06]
MSGASVRPVLWTMDTKSECEGQPWRGDRMDRMDRLWRQLCLQHGLALRLRSLAEASCLQKSTSKPQATICKAPRQMCKASRPMARNSR